MLRAGVSALVTELDEERGWLHSGSMVRRSRPLTARWLPGGLWVDRGYVTCGCAKGGRCPLDAELGVSDRAGTQATPAAAGGGTADGGDELRAGVGGRVGDAAADPCRLTPLDEQAVHYPRCRRRPWKRYTRA